MREVNNNVHNRMHGIQTSMNFQPANEEVVNEEVSKSTKETDLRNMPADVIGRSMVPVATIAVDKDVEFFKEHPKLVEKACNMFDELVARGVSSDEAAEIACAAAREFSK